MFELLSVLFGGIVRLAPELIGIFKQRQENSHELDMTRLQLEIDVKRSELRIDEVNAAGRWDEIKAEIAMLGSVVQENAKPTGIPLIDGLNASVRPVLTYWWCIFLYTIAKIHLTVWAYQSEMTLVEKANVVCNEFDRTVIGSIVGFWFVDRALRKFGRA